MEYTKRKKHPLSHYVFLCVIADTIQYFGKKYCLLYQKTILGAMQKRHRFDLGISALNDIIMELDGTGIINKIQRNPKVRDGTRRRAASAFYMTGKGWRLLNRFRAAMTNTNLWKKAKQLRKQLSSDREYEAQHKKMYQGWKNAAVSLAIQTSGLDPGA